MYCYSSAVVSIAPPPQPSPPLSLPLFGFIQCPLYMFLKTLPLTLFLKVKSLYICKSISGIHVLSHWYIYLSCQTHSVLIIVVLWSLNQEAIRIAVMFSSFKVVLFVCLFVCSSRSFHFHINFKTWLSNYTMQFTKSID